jgi:hypothetical protein
MVKIYRNIILPGHETWSLLLQEEHRLKMFENWVLKRICGPKKGSRRKKDKTAKRILVRKPGGKCG